MIRILRVFSYVVLVAACTLAVNSCATDDNPESGGFGTTTGIVTDEAGQPLTDVTVTVSGVSEEDLVATTGGDGRYSIPNVSVKLHAVKFAKNEWLTVARSITAANFNDEKVATVDMSMVSAIAKITGVITDAKNNNAPLAGVTVSVGVAGTVQSAADGTYTLPNLVADNYTLTFTKSNYVTITRRVTKADFVNDLSTFNITMGSREVLRNLTAQDLASADKWYYNEYRGGGNADDYPHWDWACDYMAALDFRGAWQEQNEGTTLQIRNSGDDRKNPADLDVFDSFVFGSKLITEDNKIMSLRVRTHNATSDAPAHFGVQVVDLAAAEATAVKIGGNRTYGSGDYADFDFDLSPYVGKEVVIAVGIYRQATGDYWKQLVLRAIRFANVKVSNWGWLPGTEAVPGWKLTQEMVRSTMPHTKKTFTGLSDNDKEYKRDNYGEAYVKWRSVNHVAAEWSFVPLRKDPDVFRRGEGNMYMIKTRGTPDVDTKVPESYLYAKFAIAPGSNQLTLRARTLDGTNYTFFKLTAIENDGTVTDVQPVSNTALDAQPAADGCWRFKHNQGDITNPGSFASFAYDLSAFDGKDVTLVFGVYNGVANTGENRLGFYQIILN